MRPSPNSTFNVHDPHGIKLLTRLRVGLSHLHEHKFRHNFQDSLDPFCNCSQHIETTIHFFLHWSNYSNQEKLFQKINNIKRSLFNQNDSIIEETFLFESNAPNDEENTCIIESTIKYKSCNSFKQGDINILDEFTWNVSCFITQQEIAKRKPYVFEVIV